MGEWVIHHPSLYVEGRVCVHACMSRVLCGCVRVRACVHGGGQEILEEVELRTAKHLFGHNLMTKQQQQSFLTTMYCRDGHEPPVH